jgi:hypothetical protein
VELILEGSARKAIRLESFVPNLIFVSKSKSMPGTNTTAYLDAVTKKQNKLECLSLAIHTGLVFQDLSYSVDFPIGGTRLERFVRDRPSSLICFFVFHKLECLSLEKFFSG